MNMGALAAREKCTKQRAANVAMNAKYHSSQPKANQSIAENAIENEDQNDSDSELYHIGCFLFFYLIL